MIRFIRRFGLVAALAAALLAAGCDQEPEQPAPKEKTGPIQVLLVAPKTGPLSPVGESMIRGAEMAVIEAQKKNPQAKRPLKLIVQDETSPQYRPGPLAGAAIVVGHALEDTLFDARGKYFEAGLPVLLPLVASSRTGEVGEGLFYRMMVSPEAQGRALGQYALDRLSARTALVLYVDQRYSRLAARNFTEVFSAREGTTIEEIMLPADPAEMSTLAKKAAEEKPDLVFLSLQTPDAIYALQALDRAKLKTAILGTHLLGVADAVPFLERYADKAFISLPFDPFNPPEAAQPFISDFEKFHHRAVDWVCVSTYDAVNLAIAALAAAGDDPAALRAWLDARNSEQTAFEGLAGRYYFPAKGKSECPVFVVEAHNGLLGRVPEAK